MSFVKHVCYLISVTHCLVVCLYPAGFSVLRSKLGTFLCPACVAMAELLEHALLATAAFIDLPFFQDDYDELTKFMEVLKQVEI